MSLHTSTTVVETDWKLHQRDVDTELSGDIMIRRVDDIAANVADNIVDQLNTNGDVINPKICGEIISGTYVPYAVTAQGKDDRHVSILQTLGNKAASGELSATVKTRCDTSTTLPTSLTRTRRR